MSDYYVIRHKEHGFYRESIYGGGYFTLAEEPFRFTCLVKAKNKIRSLVTHAYSPGNTGFGFLATLHARYLASQLEICRMSGDEPEIHLHEIRMSATRLCYTKEDRDFVSKRPKPEWMGLYPNKVLNIHRKGLSLAGVQTAMIGSYNKEPYFVGLISYGKSPNFKLAIGKTSGDGYSLTHRDPFRYRCKK